MGRFSSVLLAFVLNCKGTYIFKTLNSAENYPYVSYVIFLLSLFFLLWEISLDLECLRKLDAWADIITQFLIAMFIMEFMVNEFWFPLEEKFVSSLPCLCYFLENLLKTLGFRCGSLCDLMDFLKWPGIEIPASYLLSSFFLFCSLTATRTVDLQLLRYYGFSSFYDDVKMRAKKTLTDSMMGTGSKKKKKKKDAKHVHFCKKRPAQHCQNLNAYDSDDYCSCDCSTCSSIVF